jgi:replicative DNA helicase
VKNWPHQQKALDDIKRAREAGEKNILVTSPTGGGKTALLVHTSHAVARAELSAVAAGRRNRARPIAIFSAEMSADQIVHRMASAACGANLRTLRSGGASAEVYAAYREALSALSALPIYVDDHPAPTFAHITARLTQWSAGFGGKVALVAVDYDEKVQTEGRSEELRVSAIAQGLKALAKRHHVAVLALSQYSREANPRESPSNNWLRYSGKKEHEAAQVIHWCNPAHWVEKGEDPGSVWRPYEAYPDHGALVVTKNRFGPIGKVRVVFDPASTSFVDPGDPERAPGPRYALGSAPSVQADYPAEPF